MKKKMMVIVTVLFACACILTSCAFSDGANTNNAKITHSSENYDEYENVNVFEEAKKYGYEVSEYEGFSGYYAVFSINESSILISGQHSSTGDIGLYNCVLTKDDIMSGRFAYFATFYSDKTADERNEYGHWTFTNKHKYELVTLLKNYSETGIIAFSAFYDDATSLMNESYQRLINDNSLVACYQTIDNKYYRIIFFDNTGKSAWFVAEYTEADIEKDEYAYGLNTWNDYSGEIAGLRGSRFSRDLIKKDGLLYSSNERISELR